MLEFILLRHHRARVDAAANQVRLLEKLAREKRLQRHASIRKTFKARAGVLYAPYRGRMFLIVPGRTRIPPVRRGAGTVMEAKG